MQPISTVSPHVNINGNIDYQVLDDKVFVVESIMMAQRNDKATKGGDFSDERASISGDRTLNEYYEGAMERNMIANVAKTRGVSPETVRAAYDRLFANIWHRKDFQTYVRQDGAVSSSWASQYFGENATVKWVRDQAIDFTLVHETILDQVSFFENPDYLSATEQAEKMKLIDGLPMSTLRRKLAQVNATTWGNFTVDQLKDAMKYNTDLTWPLDTVRAKHRSEMTLTWNCLNLQLDEFVDLYNVDTHGGTRQVADRFAPAPTQTVQEDPKVALIEGSENFDTEFSTVNKNFGANWGGGKRKKIWSRPNDPTEPIVNPGSRPNDPTDPVDPPTETPGAF